MPEGQAEAEADALAEALASNVGELAGKRDLADVEMRIDARIERVAAEIRSGVAGFRADVDVRFERLEGKIEKLAAEVGLLNGLLVFITSGILALILKAFR